MACIHQLAESPDVFVPEQCLRLSCSLDLFHHVPGAPGYLRRQFFCKPVELLHAYIPQRLDFRQLLFEEAHSFLAGGAPVVIFAAR